MSETSHSILIILAVTVVLCSWNVSGRPGLVDLSWANTDGIPVWPAAPQWVTKKHIREWIEPNTRWGSKRLFHSFGSMCLSEHTGTHFDAPFHFSEKGWRNHEMPIERFIRPVLKYSLPSLRTVQENDWITATDLQKLSDKVGLPPKKGILVIETGWWRRSGDVKRYVGTTERGIPGENKETFPALSSDGVEWIVKNAAEIWGIGSDTLSLDRNPGKNGQLLHDAVLSRNIFIIENLHNLNLLPPTGYVMMVMPMKIKNGSGAPSRIMAAPMEFFVSLSGSKLLGSHSIYLLLSTNCLIMMFIIVYSI